MIRGAVLHFANDQPLICDLRALPTAQDVCLTMTNLRFVDGRRPPFIDHAQSWFLFPLSVVRFLEIPADALSDQGTEFPALPQGELAGRRDEPAGADDLDDPGVEADLLRRIREA